MVSSELCPDYAPFFGFMGATMSMILSAAGAAYGTARAGMGIANISIANPSLVMRSLIPVVMAGIIAIYGLVISVFISTNIHEGEYALFSGLVHMGAGLSTGLCGLASGIAIGYVGDAGVKAFLQQNRIFVAMVLILIFAEVLGLYGLIVSLLMNTKASVSYCR